MADVRLADVQVDGSVTVVTNDHADGSRAWAMADFRAMASPCRIVSDDEALVMSGVDTVRSLEARWSRYLDDSEVSAVNRRAGEWCLVEPDTFRLFHVACLAGERTGGRFDPLLGDRLDEFRRASSDRADVPHTVDRSDVATTSSEWSPSPWDRPWDRRRRPLDVIPEVGAVLVPVGHAFDPGGIGKGLIGDIVVEHLVAAGARRVQVELGGDVRLHGPGWSGGDWPVGVVEPVERRCQVATIDVSHGAVATSSAASTWSVDGRPAHHLIDPSTGRPADTDLASVSVVGSDLWWAEVVAKVAVMEGASGAEDLLVRHGLSGVLVHRDGSVRAVGGAAA